MSTLFLTLTAAFIIVMLAIAFLAIGWLITGKSKIQPGACGRNPAKMKKDQECGKGSCGLCEKEESNKS